MFAAAVLCAAALVATSAGATATDIGSSAVGALNQRVDRWPCTPSTPFNCAPEYLEGPVPTAAEDPHDRVENTYAPGAPCFDWTVSERIKSTFTYVPAHAFRDVTDSSQRAPGVRGGWVVAPKFPDLRVKHPTVLVMHGAGAGPSGPGTTGNPCGVWWAARLLAARGYIALVLWYVTAKDSDAKPYGVTVGDISIPVAAALSGLQFLRSKANPWHDIVDPNVQGYLGYSLGTVLGGDVQAADSHVKALVALDHLMAYHQDDRGFGGNGDGCNVTTSPELSDWVHPKVPALGVGSDALSCDPDVLGPPPWPGHELIPRRPGQNPTDCLANTANCVEISGPNKLTGYYAWKGRHLPVMQVTLTGAVHGSFSPSKLTLTEARNYKALAIKYFVPWFDTFIGYVPAGTNASVVRSGRYAALTTPGPVKAPALSSVYDDQGVTSSGNPIFAPRSAAYLPKRTFGAIVVPARYCPDLRTGCSATNPGDVGEPWL